MGTLDQTHPQADRAWPRLVTDGFPASCGTLHLWSQLLGKTRLALAPMTNHFWHVPLYVSTTGLTTSPMPYEDFAFDVELDLLESRVRMQKSDGSRLDFDLPRRGTLAAFYDRYMTSLNSLGIEVPIYPLAIEVRDTIHLDRDGEERSYDPSWGKALHGALLQADRALKRFAGDFVGKISPVHFFWGSFDLAVTRFSGRTAPQHPGGAPHCPDWVMREAYSHEVSSAGFWPGNADGGEPLFYSYAYPEPPGYAQALVLPKGARYDEALREFVFPYETLRSSRFPDRDLHAFLQSTYDAAATLGDWDRSLTRRRARQVFEPEHAS